jgi:hypothetical protein
MSRRVMKAYLLKESLDRLWSYRYEGSMMCYLKNWIGQLRWQRLNRLRKKACFQAKRPKNIPQGLKASLILSNLRHD